MPLQPAVSGPTGKTRQAGLWVTGQWEEGKCFLVQLVREGRSREGQHSASSESTGGRTEAHLGSRQRPPTPTVDAAMQALPRKGQDSLQSLAESPFLPVPAPILSPSCQPLFQTGQGTALLTTWPALALWPRSKLGMQNCPPAVLGHLGAGGWLGTVLAWCSS